MHIDLYHRLIELDRDNPKYHLMLANLLVERNESNAARAFYQIVLQLDLDCGEAYFHSGELCQKQQQWQRAISFYKTAVELKPNQVRYQYQLGEALEQFGSLSEAIDRYRQVD